MIPHCFRNFLAAISVAAASALSADACGPMPTMISDLPVFSYMNPVATTPDHNAMRYESETVAFWVKYTSGEVTSAQVAEYLRGNAEERSESALVKWLAGRKDLQAQAFLRKCAEFNAANDLIQQESWDYEPPSYTNIRRIARSIKVPKTGELRERWLFLKIRALFAAKDYRSVISLWNGNRYAISNRALRERMEGYYAGACYYTGNYVRALEIYFRLGDANSISWCMEKLAGLKSLTTLAADYPRSTATLYVLQDYVNYLAMNPAGLQIFCMPERSYGFTDTDITARRKEFIKFADEVIKAGKVASPMAWESARALVLGLLGDFDATRQACRRAATMEGDAQMRANLGRIQLFADLGETGTDEGDRTFADGLLSLYKEAQEERADASLYTLEGKPGMQALAYMYQFLIPQAVSYFSTHDMMPYACWMLQLNNKLGGPSPLSRYNDMGTGEDFVKLIELQAHPENPLAKMFAETAPIDETLLNDVAGTRLFREGHFKHALPYLEKVPAEWTARQAIFPWLNGRSLHPDKPFQRLTFTTDSLGAPRQFKADYCRQIDGMRDRYRQAEGNEKARIAAEYANALWQVSCVGDLWGISSFYWSCTRTYDNLLKDCREALEGAIAGCTDPMLTGALYYGLLALDTTSPTLRTDGRSYIMTHLQAMPQYVRTCDTFSVH